MRHQRQNISCTRPDPIWSSDLVQGDLQGPDEVFLVLDAAGYTDEAIGDADLQSVLLQHVCVSHHCTGCDDALSGTQVLAQAPGPLANVHQLLASLNTSQDLEPKHASVDAVTVVLVSKSLLRMGGQARIAHLRDFWVLLQEFRNGHSIMALLPDTESHCLAGLQDHEGREGVDDVSMHILHELNPRMHLLILGDECTSCHHVVALVVLGQALNHHVCTPVKWADHHWSGKCGVDHMLGTTSMCNVGDRLDVGQSQHRIGRCLAEHKLCVWLHRLPHNLGVSEVDEAK
mmetsp:Transcript_28495/g.50950  ORF Transcript_28495/g.50950 Transcript_28495/m.50950 type:complete len:288 (+) Transcript_28495:106-969(+)